MGFHLSWPLNCNWMIWSIFLRKHKKILKTKNIFIKSNCARPPHPKGMGYASGRALRLDGIQKQSHHRFIWSSDQNNCESASDCQKTLLIKHRKTRKMGEGSLHPQPKGWGIRDPPHSLCIKTRSRLPCRSLCYCLQDKGKQNPVPICGSSWFGLSEGRRDPGKYREWKLDAQLWDAG